MISQSYSLRPTSLRDGLSVAFRRKRLVLFCLVATLLAAVLAGMFLPRYHGEAKILVDRARVDPVLSPTPEMSNFALAAQPIVTDEDLRSEVELMKSTEVLAEVVRDLGLADSGIVSWWSKMVGRPGNQQSYEKRVTARANQLARDLVVEPAKGSYIINVVYKSRDRELAKQVLDKLVQVYMAKHTAVRHPGGQYAFFAQQTNEYRKRMEAAEASLANFAATNGSAAPAMDRTLTMQKLAEFRFSLDQTRAAIAETSQRIHRLNQQESSIPIRITTQVRKADNPQLLEQLKSSLLTLELKRSDLLAKYQPDYRPVKELDVQIAQARAAIQKELSSPMSDVTTDVDPTHQMIRTELAKAKTELAGDEAREEATQTIVNNYSARARELDTGSLQEASLQRNLKAEEDNYLLYLKKSEEARITDALDARRMVNIAVAEYPLVPALPSHSPLFFGGLAMVAMLTASFGLIWSLEHMDRTFHRPHELEAYLGIPVLISIPRQVGATSSPRFILDDEQRVSATWMADSIPSRESINGQNGGDKGEL
ncbi:MAG TPA: Wzz/FepE/Etk N-terminal domain-containing protein [Terracidiphilus sp.]